MRYATSGNIARYGFGAKLFDLSDEVAADCPGKHAQNLNEQCGARDRNKTVKPILAGDDRTYRTPWRFHEA